MRSKERVEKGKRKQENEMGGKRGTERKIERGRVGDSVREIAGKNERGERNKGD